MKKWTLFLLLLPMAAHAQKKEWVDAFIKSRPDSLGAAVVSRQHIFHYNSLYRMFDSGGKSVYLFSVQSDSLYLKIRNEFSSDSLPGINFSEQELLIYVACPQCLAVCAHEGWDLKPCHRNACMYQESWYIRNKVKPSN